MQFRQPLKWIAERTGGTKFSGQSKIIMAQPSPPFQHTKAFKKAKTSLGIRSIRISTVLAMRRLRGSPLRHTSATAYRGTTTFGQTLAELRLASSPNFGSFCRGRRRPYVRRRRAA
jgi:hypothetical protein